MASYDTRRGACALDTRVISSGDLPSSGATQLRLFDGAKETNTVYLSLDVQCSGSTARVSIESDDKCSENPTVTRCEYVEPEHVPEYYETVADLECLRDGGLYSEGQATMIDDSELDDFDYKTPEQKLWAAALFTGVRAAIKGDPTEYRWIVSPEKHRGSFRWICWLLDIKYADRIVEKVVEAFQGNGDFLEQLHGKSRANHLAEVA